MDALGSLFAKPETRILLLCSPHNPTGKVWTREELTTMAELCERHNVRVISDEIHMDLCRAPHQHTPWSETGRGEWALFTSASKSFNIPALTGAYGLISDTASREAYFHQLKACDGLSLLPCWRLSLISPPTGKVRRGWMSCVIISLLIWII